MSRKCFVCGKTAQAGNKVSYSHRKSKRKFNPNLQKINIMVGKAQSKMQKRKVYVCAQCIRSKSVRKAI